MEHSLHIFVLFLGVNVETRVNVDTQDLPGLRGSRNYEYEMSCLRRGRADPRHPRLALHLQGRSDHHCGGDGRLLSSLCRVDPRRGGISTCHARDARFLQAGECSHR